MVAIVDRPPAGAGRLGKGIARQPLGLVRAGKAYVVVERSVGQAALTPSPAAIVAHDRVVRRLHRLCPAVLPLRFGAVAPDRAAVVAAISTLSAQLDPAFERVRGAVQFTLRVAGRRNKPPAVDRGTGPGTRWLNQRLARHRVPEIECVSEATRPFVRAARAERADEARSERIGTVYHLVAREDVRRWRAAVAGAVDELPRGVHLTVSGPWPPWAFAELG
jgi:hypothetical protein